MSSSSPSTPTSATPQQIGKAFVVQYYRLLHEHPESLHRFYSTTSTFMHDDPQKTAKGIEEISKRIEELSLKQRHVKIRQVDCHSTVSSSVVVQVCGEISSSSVTDSQTQPIMKRFVQTFVLTPADNSKQKYYVHNDIFRYQDSPTPTSTPENTKTTSEATAIETPITPSASSTIEFYDNTVAEKKEAKSEGNATSTVPKTPPATPAVADPTKEQSSKPKSYRDAIAKKEKSTAAAAPPSTNPTTTTTATAAAATAAGATATENQSAASTKKSNKQQKKAAAKGNANANRNQRGHPQDANDYYDDSWYYENEGVEAYLSTGYTDDQEIFVGNLSAQVTENEIHELFRSYGTLLLVRIGNTGSQVGAANFAFVVCQSIEMAKAIVADRETFSKTHQVNIEAKKRRPFPHTFRPTYPTAASPTSYQSTGYPAALYNQSSYYEGVPTRGVRRGGRGGAK